MDWACGPPIMSSMRANSPKLKVGAANFRAMRLMAVLGLKLSPMSRLRAASLILNHT
jgi:hypothetical protein